MFLELCVTHDFKRVHNRLSHEAVGFLAAIAPVNLVFRFTVRGQTDQD